MNLNKTILIIILSFSTLYAQDIGVTKVEILQEFNPEIPDVNRLNENAVFADTLKEDRVLTYDVINTVFSTNFKTKPLVAAEVKMDKINELLSTKVNLGFGNFWLKKANFVFNSKRSTSFTYGLIANHFSNKFSANKNSDNNIKIFAKKVSKDFILLSSLNYDRKTNLYKKGDKILNDDFYRNRFAYSKLSIDAFRNNNRSSLLSAFNFFISDFNEMSENQIHFSALLNKRIKNQFYNLDISFDNYLNYNNSNTRFQSLDYKIVSFLPSTVFKIKGFNLCLSADLDLLLNDKRIGLYPELKLSKELVENVLFIDAGLRHIKKRNTYKSLTDQNPFVHSFGTNQSIFMQNYFLQELKNSDTYEVYFFLKNKLSSNESLQFESSYGNISEFSQFTLFDNSHYERFKVDYLRSVNQLYFSASYEYLINRILTLKSNLNYSSWNKDILNKPKLQFDLSIPVNLRSKIMIIPTFSYFGERMSVRGNLPSQFHASLCINYLYSRQLTGYLEFNNITNSKKDVFFGYQEVGFNGVFGVSFSF
jgi:hypothetical protein